MDLPLDIKLPNGFRPGLSPGLRRDKLIGRIWLEARCIFNRSQRTTELAEFDAYWDRLARESMASRLAFYEFRDQYGQNLAMWAATPYHGRPKTMPTRAKVYQLNVKFEARVDEYRAKLGLPPRNATEGPKPP
jgi:hypothetical protein